MRRAEPGSRGEQSLRQIATIAAIALAAMAAAVSMSLIVLTTDLHEASETLRETVRGVGLARNAEVDLLAHSRAVDPVVRDSLDDRLHAAIREESRRPASSPEVRHLRDDAAARVERYLAMAPESEARPAELEGAVEALEHVVRANIEDADEAAADSARTERLGERIGWAAAASMIAIPALLLFWIRRSVIHPMLALSDAMDRFRKGDLTVRARAAGAVEIRRMTGQFNAMGEAIERQHRARLTHLAGVAHDLRNPLAALQMSTALVDPDQPLPPERHVRRAFAVVRRQVGRLSRMVEDLLDTTRIEAGQLSLGFEDTDVRGIVQDVAELFRDTSPLHELRVDVVGEPLVVRCDPLRIEQTLSNLVSNAIKYSPRGGLVRIMARRSGAGDMVEIAVADEGGGISEAELPRIWEPFRRKGVSDESIPGVGLGLWTARKIVDAHGGSLDARSELGAGSTFTIALPLVQPASAAHATTEATTAAQPSGAPVFAVPAPGGPGHG